MELPVRFAESAGLSQQPNIFGFASQRFMRGFPFLPNVVFLVSWSFGLQSPLRLSLTLRALSIASS